MHTINTVVSTEYRAELYTRLENRRIKQLVRRNRNANEKESGRQPLKERKVYITDSTLKAEKKSGGHPNFSYTFTQCWESN